MVLSARSFTRNVACVSCDDWGCDGGGQQLVYDGCLIVVEVVDW